MRTREKIRIVKAFKSGKSVCERLAFECAKSIKDTEDAIRWGLRQTKKHNPYYDETELNEAIKKGTKAWAGVDVDDIR